MKKLAATLFFIILCPVYSWAEITFTNGYWQMGFSRTDGDPEFCGTVNGGVYTPSFDTLTCDKNHWQCHGIDPDCTGTGTTYTYDYIWNCDINYSSGGNCNTSPTKVAGNLTTSADRTGSGGNGWRTYRGPCIDSSQSCPTGPDGVYHRTNDNGRLNITFPSGSQPTEFWIRFYVRYETGFTWNQSPQQYKFIYVFANGNNDPHPVVEMTPTVWYWAALKIPSALYVYTGTWNSLYPTGASDGTWHNYEFHFKMSSAAGIQDGVLETWVDGINTVSRSDIAYKDSGSTGTAWSYIWIPLNGGYWNNGSGGAQHAGYMDYDDIAVALPGYGGFAIDAGGRKMIGPIGLGPNPPPARPENLLIK